MSTQSSAGGAAAAPRTLADQLRGWPDERLGILLRQRPDLATPAPADSAQLAGRAVVRTSVARALDLLDRLELAVLSAVVQEGPTDSSRIREVVQADPDAVDAALDRLCDLALVWGSPETWRPLTVVAELLGVPGGPEPGAVAGLLAELDDRARSILDHLDESDAAGTVADSRVPARREQASTPLEQLLVRRLLAPRGDRHVVIPWTVLLHLRNGHSTRDRVDAVPELAAGERAQEMVDRAGAGAAYEFTRRVEMLLEHWALRPPGGLRGGGLGVRDLRAAADLLHAEATVAALVVETAAAAGLVALGMNDELDSAWLPTDAYDAWVNRSGAERWTVLAHAWLDNPRLVSAVGGREGDKPVNALTPGLERAWLAGDRRSVLRELATLEPGRVLASGTGVPALVTRLQWRHPRLPAARLAEVGTMLEEASALGMAALGGLTSYGRRLLAGDDPAAGLDALLPPPVDHVLIQADLTAVAPGPLERSFAHRLGLLADVESRGGATVYRFSADSVRRAFDSGWSAIEVKDFLRESSRTPVPQSLDYLVEDVSRRFGTLRVGVAESFLRSDDETALTELLHHRDAASLRLRRIAPTVVVSDVPLQVLLPRLRELGAAPVVEAPDGTVRVARPEEYRARTPKHARTAGRDAARQAARVSAVVAAVRAGDRAAAERPSRGPATTPADVMAVLREAVESRREAWIGYLDNHGSTTERIVRPVEVGGGQLSAYDERTDEVRTFAIHRITQARVAG
ncbi:MAG TPA: helicase-associated domain-containing protein [Marmoricola sp.]|nr:helicase-associated domain-containing protein [Marmoricola sp.]